MYDCGLAVSDKQEVLAEPVVSFSTGIRCPGGKGGRAISMDGALVSWPGQRWIPFIDRSLILLNLVF